MSKDAGDRVAAAWPPTGGVVILPSKRMLGFIAAWAAISPALGAGPVFVQAEARGVSVAIEAHATVDASLPVAWGTITDYDHLAEFIPGMKESRTVRRQGSAATIQQRGETKFLFFHFPVQVVIAADEHYPSSIDAHSIEGNIRLLSASYRLQRVPGTEHLLLRWSGVVEPQFWTPMFITVSMLRETVEDQFRAMVEEIERRQARSPGARRDEIRG